MQDKVQPRNTAIDALRIISILAVVIIHTTTRTFEVTQNDLIHLPWTLFLNQSARFAVPLFFMISGFVLELNYHNHENYGAYLKKRVQKVFIPYVFWSLIYYFLVYQQHHGTNFIRALITGSSSHQLYFIPTLLIFYLIFPLLHRYFREVNRIPTIAILGTFQVGILYTDYFIHPLPFFYPISIALLNFFVFVLGVVTSHHQDRLISSAQKWKRYLLPLSALLAFYVFWEGRNLFLKTNNYLAFYSQWRPSVLIYTIVLAVSLYYYFNKLKSKNLIKTLANLSFFVFFIHIIVLELIWYFFGNFLFQKTHALVAGQFWYDPLFFGLTVFISFLIAYLVRKIPFLAKLSG